MASPKKYGLIVPDKNKSKKPVFQAKRNIFGDESDSDEEPKTTAALRPSHNINRLAKVTQEKALQEDPTVYQYDEIYDSMTTTKESQKEKKKEDTKPQYIENLLKAASKRKIESERRIERQIQKEREKEGDEFADKEVFVTSAYKKKLEDMQKEEEKEKREEYLESIGDVTKQKGLGGFYRHLYEQKLGSDKIIETKAELDTDSKPHKTDKAPETYKKSEPQPDIIKKNKKDKGDSNKKKKKDKGDSKRNYRKRKTSEVNNDLSEGEIVDSDDEINRVNLKAIHNSKRMKNNDENIDADSDFSVDDPSSDEGEIKDDEGKKKLEDSQTSMPPPPTPEESSDKVLKDKDLNKKDKSKENTPKNETPPAPPKPKVDIWKKRTVGEAFEQALKRYYERKAARQG